jgi:hypothetical protein
MTAIDGNLKLILLFVGVFLLSILVITSLGGGDKNETTNYTEVQDPQSVERAEAIENTKPFVLGISGLQIIILVVLVLGGIGTFIMLISGSMGRGKHRL